MHIEAYKGACTIEGGQTSIKHADSLDEVQGTTTIDDSSELNPCITQLQARDTFSAMLRREGFERTIC